MTARTRAAISKLKQAGIPFTITSSRPLLGMKPIVDALKLTQPIATFNGSVFVRPDYSIIEQKVLPTAIALNSRSAIRLRE